MTEPTPEAYEAALNAAFPGLPEAIPLDEAHRRTSAAVDAVWPIAEATVRAKVAAEIRAECERIRPSDMAQFDGLVGMATRGAYANAAKIAARIAEGNGDETKTSSAGPSGG